MTRQDFACSHCHFVQEYQVPFGEKGHHHCAICGSLMYRYFGFTDPHDLAINYGYRESHYTNETDANIAKFQFANL